MWKQNWYISFLPAVPISICPICFWDIWYSSAASWIWNRKDYYEISGKCAPRIKCSHPFLVFNHFLDLFLTLNKERYSILLYLINFFKIYNVIIWNFMMRELWYRVHLYLHFSNRDREPNTWAWRGIQS